MPTPQTTAEQLKDPNSSSSDTPPKKKAPTKAEVQAELDALAPVAAARMLRIRDLEVKIQRAKDLLKETALPGITLERDYHRLTRMVRELRELLEVIPDGQ